MNKKNVFLSLCVSLALIGCGHDTTIHANYIDHDNLITMDEAKVYLVEKGDEENIFNQARHISEMSEMLSQPTKGKAHNSKFEEFFDIHGSSLNSLKNVNLEIEKVNATLEKISSLSMNEELEKEYIDALNKKLSILNKYANFYKTFPSKVKEHIDVTYKDQFKAIEDAEKALVNYDAFVKQEIETLSTLKEKAKEFDLAIKQEKESIEKKIKEYIVNENLLIDKRYAGIEYRNDYTEHGKNKKECLDNTSSRYSYIFHWNNDEKVCVYYDLKMNSTIEHLTEAEQGPIHKIVNDNSEKLISLSYQNATNKYKIDEAYKALKNKRLLAKNKFNGDREKLENNIEDTKDTLYSKTNAIWENGVYSFESGYSHSRKYKRLQEFKTTFFSQTDIRKDINELKIKEQVFNDNNAYEALTNILESALENLPKVPVEDAELTLETVNINKENIDKYRYIYKFKTENDKWVFDTFNGSYSSSNESQKLIYSSGRVNYLIEVPMEMNSFYSEKIKNIVKTKEKTVNIS